MCFAEFIHCQRYQLWIPCTIACLDAVLPTSHKPEQAGIRVALASLHQLVVLAALGGSHVLGRVVTVHGLRLEQGKRWRRRTRNPWVLKVVFFSCSWTPLGCGNLRFSARKHTVFPSLVCFFPPTAQPPLENHGEPTCQANVSLPKANVQRLFLRPMFVNVYHHLGNKPRELSMCVCIYTQTYNICNSGIGWNCSERVNDLRF